MTMVERVAEALHEESPFVLSWETREAMARAIVAAVISSLPPAGEASSHLDGAIVALARARAGSSGFLEKAHDAAFRARVSLGAMDAALREAAG